MILEKKVKIGKGESGFFDLPQSLVKYYSDGGCKIQAADIGVWHRDGQTAFPVGFQNVFGQSAGFSPEDETIIILKLPVGVTVLGFGRKIQKTRIGQTLIKLFQIEMAVDFNFVPVVQARAFDSLFVEPETGNADDVEISESGGAEAGDISRIRRNFRFNQRDMKHTI